MAHHDAGATIFRMRLLAAVISALLLSACGHDARSRTGALRLATTTSTENSGLLDHLLRVFTAETGVRVQAIGVGTGQALALGARGDADVVLVHDRMREDAFVAAGHAPTRHDVMWNDFVVLGPAADPAGIRGLTDPSLALARIHEKQARFVSRGDDSGTHARERRLWEQRGLDPTGTPGYVDAGQGMGACLTIADEKRAYILSDRGTYLAFSARIELEVLVEGHKSLRNPYGVMVVRGPNAERAKKLVAFLTAPEGQRLIGAYRVNDHVLFHPHAKPD